VVQKWVRPFKNGVFDNGGIKLASFKEPIQRNSLVVAPFEANGQVLSYHRALVLYDNVSQGGKTPNSCLIRFVDYGDDAIVDPTVLREVPDTQVNVNKAQKLIRDIPFMAVKYRLQGLEVMPTPRRYAHTLWKQGERVKVDIFSTADGDVVKVDVTGSNKENYREKLLNNGYATEVDESYIHKISNQKWKGKYSPSDPDTPISGAEGKSPDSGHVSDSSHDATVDRVWIDLKDTSSDSGMFSPTNELKGESSTIILKGPFNSFNCSIESTGM